ncbi:uncharacterized protein LY89DRAFT_681687 [Mollisia scopiformis]|uniref:3',5'-cyclic-nucleotide phosphodiesterase n=1 Tax=Mollisia scopiformis TaxID=149040 RepID=A0A194XLV2_MOLSC|nr:uncharacterized protein LY89DRAFT_681687 [Mollisia scopiformis]KUJ21064.1 hypothetical protein LY89DRAFT_681687 [Mollisia scopiformis]
MGEGVEQPALQVIVLGAGGGPKEDNVTAFLVRSTAAGWKKGSLLAVDAGVHLAAIARILDGHKSIRTEDSKPPAKPITLVDGPFEGLQIAEGSSPSANAAFITRDLVECFLITHPHLDHISGFVINTASLPSARPKRLAGLPSTIEAFKNHIFNNIIWPNLTDENNGAGLVTYLRLVEGGTPALGDGYIEVSDGLSIKTWSVSHGHCIERHNHRGSNAGSGFVTSPGVEASPRLNPTSGTMVRSSSQSSRVADDNLRADQYSQRYCVYDSSAYFIRDIATNKEILIYGDVEPDSISYSPRNRQVWADAAPKVASGMLGAIFIECSYDDSRQKELLFGHLTPKYLVEELRVLGNEVKLYINMAKNGPNIKKRKLDGDGNGSFLLPYARRRSTRNESPTSPTSRRENRGYVSSDDGTSERQVNAESHDHGSSPTPVFHVSTEAPLEGVKIVVIHMKEKLDDGPDLGELILKQLKGHEKGQLGCEFIISYTGQSLYF